MIGEGMELKLRSAWGFLWTVEVTLVTKQSIEVKIAKGIDKAFWSMSCSGLQKAMEAV